MIVIQLRDLTKRFGDKTAVDRLTLELEPGAVTGFLGPNGAGKSTTMRLILGLDAPTSGAALIGGRRYAELDQPLRTVGALLDAKATHPARTGRNHLRAMATSQRIPLARVEEVLALTGMTEAARRRTGTYSLGMSQRLGIAGALLGDPEVLMLDEPVNGLDPDGVRWIRTLLRSLAAEGRTVFVSSHLMSEMELTADRLVVIGRGRLIADRPMSGMLAGDRDAGPRTGAAAPRRRAARLTLDRSGRADDPRRHARGGRPPRPRAGPAAERVGPARAESGGGLPRADG